MNNISGELINCSIHRFENNLPRIEKCLSELTEDEIWKRPNNSSNSVGNLVLHLCGNITQYVISSLGNQPFDRDRDAEFSAEGGYSGKVLLEKSSVVVNQAVAVMKRTSDEELMRVRRVQVFDVSGIDIVIHVTEHFSYHTGQIVFWTKLLKDKDMGFYKGVQL